MARLQIAIISKPATRHYPPFSCRPAQIFGVFLGLLVVDSVHWATPKWENILSCTIGYHASGVVDNGIYGLPNACGCSLLKCDVPDVYKSGVCLVVRSTSQRCDWHWMGKLNKRCRCYFEYGCCSGHHGTVNLLEAKYTKSHVTHAHTLFFQSVRMAVINWWGEPLALVFFTFSLRCAILKHCWCRLYMPCLSFVWLFLFIVTRMPRHAHCLSKN